MGKVKNINKLLSSHLDDMFDHMVKEDINPHAYISNHTNSEL